MASDSIMLSAVLSVLHQVGLDAKVGEEGHVYVIGIDGAPEALDEIRASGWTRLSRSRSTSTRRCQSTTSRAR